MKIIIVMNIFILASGSYGNPCPFIESVNITGGYEFSNNGSVLYNGVIYPHGEWYDSEEDGHLTRFGCPCIRRVCLWKCCEQGQEFVGRECTDTSGVFNPPVFKGAEPSSIVASDHFLYMYNTLCEDRYRVDSLDPMEEIYIQENGTLFEIAAGGLQWLAPTVYCVDMMRDNSSEVPRLVAGVCYPDDVYFDDSPVLYIAYGVGLLLSVPFLLATFIVYAMIPDLRNLHGMCLMAYCAGLIIAYPVLAYLKLHTGKIGIGRTGCVVSAFIIYYAFQSSFFWLNVMCFDIWRTFSGYRGGGSTKRREKRRFVMYGLYAWGVPLALTLFTIIMQVVDLPDYLIQPGLGDRRCWFEDWLRELLYFFTPVLVLVVCNVTLFSVTAHRIRSIKQETAILKGSESSRSDKLRKDKERYGLYLKLFIVMGVNWTVELISFIVGGSTWYWIIVDVSNIILGFFIFLIFVWKNKVRNLITKRWRASFGGPVTSTDMARSSTMPTEDTRVSGDETIRLKDLH